MAEAALFVGFGQAVRARETQALDLFKDVLALHSDLRDKGAIESFEAVLLESHGGDLQGFFLIRGSRDQLHELRADEGFRRTSTRAGLVLDGLGVIDAYVGDGLQARLSLYEQQVNEQLSA